MEDLRDTETIIDNIGIILKFLYLHNNNSINYVSNGLIKRIINTDNRLTIKIHNENYVDLLEI